MALFSDRTGNHEGCHKNNPNHVKCLMSCAPGAKILKYSASISKAEGDEPAVHSAHKQCIRKRPQML